MTPQEIQRMAARIKARMDAMEVAKLAELSAAEHEPENAQSFWDKLAAIAAEKAGWDITHIRLRRE